MLWVPALLSAAFAQEAREVAPGDFVVRPGDAVATVTAIGIPPPVATLNPDRSCKVEFLGKPDGTWRGVVQPDCNPVVAWAAAEALQAWRIVVDPAPARARRLFEAWYVFPATREEPVHIVVRPAWDTPITALTDAVDVFDYELNAVMPPRYPLEAPEGDTSVTQCDVDIDLGRTMSPVHVAARRCDPVFRAAAEDAVKDWLIETPDAGDLALSGGLTVGVQFVWDVEQGRGRSQVTLPPKPDLGGRDRALDQAGPRYEDIPPREGVPDGDPRFVLGHDGNRDVGIYDMVWPEPYGGARPATCDVLVQTNDLLQIRAWPGDVCDSDVEIAVIEAVRQWLVMPQTRGRGSASAKFRGTFVFPADSGHPVFRVAEGDVKSRIKMLPEWVETVRIPQAVQRVPPKRSWWDGVDLGAEPVFCSLGVQVQSSGRPGRIRALDCPDALLPAATKAVSRWRWIPAATEGQTVPFTVKVSVRFDPSSAP